MVEHDSCPTGEISQLRKPESEIDRLRRLTLREITNLAHGRTERRRVVIIGSRSRALARVGVRLTAQNARRRDVPVARRKTCRLPAERRAGCAPQDAPVARRKTCRLRAARRACGTPQHVPFARRNTCRLRVARRAGCASQDAPVARRKTCRLHAVCVRGPVRSFRWRWAAPRICRVADGAASPGRLGRGASPFPLAATGSST